MSKEKFEDRKLTGPMRITCKFEDGTVRHWEDLKENVIAYIVKTVESYARQGYSMTLRQLHYQLVKANMIVNHEKAYKKLGEILDDCRYAGLIDWDAIVDRGRVPHLEFYTKDIPSALKTIHRAYKLDRQLGQSDIVEVWTEKDALSEILTRVTNKYHVRLVVNKGYTSSSAIYTAYDRITDAKITNGQRLVILYIGDHDPSGLDMIRDIRERLTFMLINGDYEVPEDEVDDYFQIVPIGLNMEQIRRYNLPPNPTKATDSRADGYIAKYGQTCWEVDALDLNVLVDLLTRNIEAQINLEQYEAMIAREKKDKRLLLEFIETHGGNTDDTDDDDQEDEDA